MNESNPIPPEIPPQTASHTSPQTPPMIPPWAQSEVPPQVPPLIPPEAPPYLRDTPPLRKAPQPPLGDDPAERLPIPHVFGAIDAILRQPRRVMFQLRQSGAGRLIASMLGATVVCALIYGVVAGTFIGGAQLWIAPAKIALGLLISALICLPSLYIFSCLSGSQARLVEISGLLGGLLMLMTVLLIGFAPVAWIFSQSTDSSVWMGALHLAFWLVATGFGLRFLATGFGHTNARSEAGFYTWIVIFVLVAVQMTTALRPIIGKGDTFLPTEKKFFAAYWQDCFNAANQPAKPAASIQ